VEPATLVRVVHDSFANTETPMPGNVLDKAVSLLAAFGRDGWSGIGVTELARRTQLSKSTAFRLLAMLERNGLIERVGNGYRLGQLLQSLAEQIYPPGNEWTRDVLTPFLIDLLEATHQAVHLAVLHGTEILYLSKLHGHRPPPSPSRVGGRGPAHSTALGKVLLARNPDALDRTLERGLHAWTRNTVSTPAGLRAELDNVRRVGVAFDREETQMGLSCVAAPILGRSGRPIAAISVWGSRSEMGTGGIEGALRRVAHAATCSLVAAAQREPRRMFHA